MRILWLLVLLISTGNGFAFSWSDLWLTNDQQAQMLMQSGKFKQAEIMFKQEDWRAAAAYRAGDYAQAAKQYQVLQSEQSYYNKGNALAHLGQYEKAIKAYDKALAINPSNKDASFNRKLLANLLKKNQHSKGQQGQNQQGKNQQGQNQQDQNQQGQNQQDQNQQGQNQQGQNQQGQNQQGQNQQGQNQQGQNQQGQNQQDKDQQGQNQQDQNQQGQNQQDQNQQGNEQANQGTAGQSAEDLEKQQAKEQWLRLIPDDPGGLMREKFLRDHLRREGRW